MMKILLVLLIYLLSIQGAEAFERIDVKMGRIRDFAYEENGEIFVRPSLLEQGEKWKIAERNEKLYVMLQIEEKSSMEEVEIPVKSIKGNQYVDLSFFAKQAGLTYTYDPKRKKLNVGRIKKEKALDDNRKIIFMWDPQKQYDPARPYFTKAAGRRILSPTWGSYKELDQMPLSEAYLQMIRRADLEIMPLVHNDFNIKETKRLMQDKTAMEKMAGKLTAISLVYDFGGWNIDFENMDPADSERYTDFIKVVSEKLHKHDKELSVDITVYNAQSPNWSLCYDRKALARYGDYEILMGYDQTPRGSLSAGSVSSYRWLDDNIKVLLEEVPHEKLILGLPLYTRIWQGVQGKAKSSVLPMKQLASLFHTYHVRKIWDMGDKQYIGSWVENRQPKKFWMEDVDSLAIKMDLIRVYDLAGVAFWRYGFEPEDLYFRLEPKLVQDLKP